MFLPLTIAKRYLFSKKSTNAINIISGIAIASIAIGCASLLIIMSVFNGLEDLIASLYNSFNPEIKVQPKTGKTFEVDSNTVYQLSEIEGVAAVSTTIEEVAFFRYKDSEHFGMIKGVDEAFKTVTKLDTSVNKGTYVLKEDGKYFALLGLGLEYQLGIDVNNPFHFLKIYVPKAKNKGGLANKAFNVQGIDPEGVFVTEQEIDSKYVVTHIDFVRKMLQVSPNTVGTIEIALDKGVNIATVQKQIQTLLGEQFTVQNRKQQEAEFYRLMKVEKWIAYAVICLTLVLIVFNMIGALWMLVLEKKRDIAVLKAMGANAQLVARIFQYQGVLMTAIGVVVGFGIAVIAILAQQTFGIVKFAGAGTFVVEAYPISMRWFDFVIVFVTIVLIGYLASLIPSKKAAKMVSLVRDL